MDINDIKRICELLCNNNSFLILSHKNPDGDAVGSTSALAAILENIGKHARILYPDEVPERLKFILQGREYMTPEIIDESFKPELIVALDSASASRLGVLEEKFALCVDLSIDHHLSNTPYAHETYTDPHAAATCEIVFETVKELVSMNILTEISPDIAFPIYAGIASDTGSFKYSNTSAHTFEICAELITKGINVSEISRLLFDRCSINKLRAEALATERLKLFADGKVALITVPQEAFSSRDMTYDDFDDVVDIARKIAGVEVGIYIRNAKTIGTFKVSLRSNEYVNVSELCAKHDGGGHLRAAGCAISADSIETAADIILKDVLAAV